MPRRDHSPGGAVMRRAAASLAAALLAAALEATARPAVAGAQMLASPVLQNAFGNRGLTMAVNYGSASGVRSYALAAAYGSQRRFVVSIGAGALDPTDADVATRANYGARIAVMGPRFLNRTVGIAAFSGAGGVPRNGSTPAVTTFPAGLAAGYRRSLGATRGIAVYAAPFYSWSRSGSGASKRTSGLFRVSGGVDVGISSRIGVTVGAEGGAKAKAGDPGASSTVFGAGLAYSFR